VFPLPVHVWGPQGELVLLLQADSPFPLADWNTPWQELVLVKGPDVMFEVVDLDPDDDTIEVRLLFPALPPPPNPPPSVRHRHTLTHTHTHRSSPRSSSPGVGRCTGSARGTGGRAGCRAW
jgi:hypothetical protein